MWLLFSLLLPVGCSSFSFSFCLAFTAQSSTSAVNHIAIISISTDTNINATITIVYRNKIIIPALLNVLFIIWRWRLSPFDLASLPFSSVGSPTRKATARIHNPSLRPLTPLQDHCRLERGSLPFPIATFDCLAFASISRLSIFKVEKFKFRLC